METSELIASIPDFLGRYLDGAEPRVVVHPSDGIDGTWAFRQGRVIAAVKILEQTEMRITVGLTVDTPYAPEVAEYVNHLNFKVLVFGRMFLIGDIPFIGGGSGPCAVLMQEIVFGNALSFDFPPSMQNLLNVVARLCGQGDRLAADLVERFGGRLFGEEDAIILTLH